MVVGKNKSSSPVTLPRVFRGGGTRYVSITGGKGGVGKSSISVNLALALAQLGGRVLLIDGDLGLANADQLLGVHAPATLWDVIQRRVDLEKAVLETPFGISLLPAASGRQEMAELDEASRSELLSGIRMIGEKFDFVLIDTAAGIGDTAINLAAAGDMVLAVATPDPTSARDAFSIMKILSKDFGINRISLVANMVGSKEDGMTLFRQLSSVTTRFLPLSLGLAGAVVRDPAMAKSILERRPLLSSYPGSPAAKQIQQIATHIVRLDKEMREADGERGTAGRLEP